MRADEIMPSGHYAYLDPDFPGEPLRAVALELPENGVVRVAIHHPDTGPFEDHVATRTLHGGWEDKATGDRWKAVIAELREAGEPVTWASVALIRVNAVRRQRALADRLARTTGIVREKLHYAGRGGTTSNRHHALLQLNYDELEELLSRAENGPAYTPRPRPEVVQT